MKSILILFICLLSISLLAQDAYKIKGYWLTQDGDSQVKIFKATNGKYYGKIVWLKDPYDDDGSPRVDDKNPNEKLKTRPILELMLLNKFEYDKGKNEWNNGTIYDPKTGNTYKCYIWFEGDNMDVLHVKGYIGLSLIGRKVEWKRENALRTL